MKKRKNKKKKISNILFIIFLIIIIPILVLSLTLLTKSLINPSEVPDFFGYKPMIVMSGSMESKISKGDVAIVKEVDFNKLKVKDIIAFKTSDETIVTHRIIKINEENNSKTYITKGDRNNKEDNGVVTSKNFEGIYIFKIPFLGEILMWLQKPSGLLISILIVMIGSGGYFLAKSQKELNDIKSSKN